MPLPYIAARARICAKKNILKRSERRPFIQALDRTAINLDTVLIEDLYRSCVRPISFGHKAMQRRRAWRCVELLVYVRNILPGVVVQVIDF